MSVETAAFNETGISNQLKQGLIDEAEVRLQSKIFNVHLEEFPPNEVVAYHLSPEDEDIYILNSTDTPLTDSQLEDIQNLLEIFSWRTGNRLASRLFAIWLQPQDAFEFDWQLGETKFGYVTLSERLFEDDVLKHDYHGIAQTNSAFKIMLCHELGHVEDVSFFGELGEDYADIDPAKRVASTNFDALPYWVSEGESGLAPLTPYAKRRNLPTEDRAESTVFDVLGDQYQGSTLEQLDVERYRLIQTSLANLLGQSVSGPPYVEKL